MTSRHPGQTADRRANSQPVGPVDHQPGQCVGASQDNHDNKRHSRRQLRMRETAVIARAQAATARCRAEGHAAGGEG